MSIEDKYDLHFLVPSTTLISIRPRSLGNTSVGRIPGAERAREIEIALESLFEVGLDGRSIVAWLRLSNASVPFRLLLPVAEKHLRPSSSLHKGALVPATSQLGLFTVSGR